VERAIFAGYKILPQVRRQNRSPHPPRPHPRQRPHAARPA
jgi:hypothetical protein